MPGNDVGFAGEVHAMHTPQTRRIILNSCSACITHCRMEFDKGISNCIHTLDVRTCFNLLRDSPY